MHVFLILLFPVYRLLLYFLGPFIRQYPTLIHLFIHDTGCELFSGAAEMEAVVVKAMRPFKAGQAVLLNDPRPNSEQILATGTLQRENFSDYLLYEVALVPTDQLYTAKREVLRSQDLQVRFQPAAFTICIMYSV